MAQRVGYYENNVEYKEGPFVLCQYSGNHSRIEVEYKGHRCPALPAMSIYAYLNARWGDPQEHQMEEICDDLNRLVKEKVIVLDPQYGKTWVFPGRD